ncbi:hypothetical protein OA93_18880 [Flavobacterium sp. KMS]|jgi:Cu/Ag efflux pump CusA|uniref:hypothetical protein n=1 Tax=Flavobacterium sp. KMS TaxID=1566023 RepID=UPI000580B1F7|nr:hypothetical protein [Flavobacterium sp. KMS]KIA95015.1 hypothetical protein OA93_18880 [Flavobacterium sp. KMS]KIA97374.1 hypothetical protein OA88_21295 [Flavobacterium sp. JRM]
MLTKIIEFSVRNKLIVGLIIIALIGYGSYEATNLPIVDAVPDITNNQVQIITIALSFRAKENGYLEILNPEKLKNKKLITNGAYTLLMKNK